MALLPENQSDRLRCYRNALGNWKVTGCVAFRERPEQWLRIEFPKYSARNIAQMLYEHVVNGGAIDEQSERRPEWDDHEFHYDLRAKIDGRLIYFETLLFCDDPDDPDDPTITVVNVHDA